MLCSGLSKCASRILLLIGVFLYVFLAGCISFYMNHRSTSAGIFKQIPSQQTGKCQNCGHFFMRSMEVDIENGSIYLGVLSDFIWYRYNVNTLSCLHLVLTPNTFLTWPMK